MDVRPDLRRAIRAAAVVAGAVLLRPGTRANRLVRRQVDATGRRLRRLGGQLRGTSYRLAGRRPDPDVGDDVLADRVRSSLGPLRKRLDLPRLDVGVHDRVVRLHGEVGGDGEAHELERAAAAVSGVAGVESYLHVGLDGGRSRPSDGSGPAPRSPAHRALLDAARSAGVAEAVAPLVVRAVLAAMAERIPEGERDHVASHLPPDVRTMFRAPRRTHHAPLARTVRELVADIALEEGSLRRDDAEVVVGAVVRALRGLVPEEADDVAAVLPQELRALWLRGSSPAGTSRP